MAGGDGVKSHAYNASGRSLAGEYMGLVMEKAVKMGESNACMKRIVAAPTAGACGVIPAVFLSYEEYCKETENRMLECFLPVQESVRLLQKMRASPVHRVDARRRLVQQVRWQQEGPAYSPAGRRCGVYRECSGTCPQEYVGTKPVMPVCGLLEVPCIKRNSAGAVNAAVSAQMAMAGIKSAIPADEVVRHSMRRIGNALPAALRETSEGGLAVTESARKIAERMGKKEHIA